MEDTANHQQAIELLQQLGLKEYESKCFVALSRLPKGTAKEISEISDVPRTRVYDAIRVLDAKGLVEVQHSSPQQFRAVPIGEAGETLRQEYESRTETLVKAIEEIEPAEPNDDREVTHEVWSLSGATAIRNRTAQLVDRAGEEVILVVGRESALSEALVDGLRQCVEVGVSVIVGTQTESLRETIQRELPEAEVFVSGLEWLKGSSVDPADETTITRLLLVDGNTILVSSASEADDSPTGSEKAVFGRGFDNGLVVITRRLMATGLRQATDTTTPGS